MKAAVILCLLLNFYQANAYDKVSDETFTSTEELCIQELKLNPAQIARLNNKNFVPDGNLKYGDFIGCYWQKMGWQNSNGEIDYAKLKQDIDHVYEEIDSSTEDSESYELNPEDRQRELKVLINAIEKCQYNPPATGITFGQTALRIRNCIASALERMEVKGQY